MKFSTRYPLYLIDGPQQIDISQDFAPIQIQANFGLLLGRAKNLKYYQWLPGTNRRCVINVMDSENIVRFSACFTDDALYINKKIRVRQNGSVEYRRGPVENEIYRAELTLKVDTQREFRITIFAFNQNFLFEASQNEIKLIPSEWTSIECSICFATMFGRTVKLTLCGHMFCTACILQACEEKNECPLCRKIIRTNDLRDIFLQN